MRRFAFAILILILTTTLHARWSKLQGRFANVEFQPAYQPLARQLLSIAEQEIPRLALLQGMDSTQIAHLPRARIILTDQPDISNGYAMGNSVVIYALSSMYMLYWSTNADWYRLVLTHELAHWVTFHVTQRKLNFLGNFASLSVPRWFYEGIAQYLAEEWNPFRGNVYLKHALLYGKLNYNSLENLQQGRLLYATAHAFIRYLAWQYGDSALTRLLNFKKDGWYFDFDEAFEEVFGESAKILFARFNRQLVLDYGALIAQLPELTPENRLPAFVEKPQQVLVISSKDSLFLVAGRQKAIDRFNTLSLFKRQNGRSLLIRKLSNRLATPVILSPDHEFVAWGEPYLGQNENQITYRLRWKLTRLQNDVVQYLGNRPFRARYGAFDYQNRFHLVEIFPDSTVIWRFASLSQKKPLRWLAFKQPVGRLTFTPDGATIMEVQTSRGRKLFARKNDSLFTLPVQHMPFNPHYAGRDLLVYNAFVINQPAIGIFSLAQNRTLALAVDQYDDWLSAVDSTTGRVIFFRHAPDGKREFFSIAIDSLLRQEKQPMSLSVKTTNSWQTKSPPKIKKQVFPSKDHPANLDEKRVPYFPMEHLLSIATPFYDPQLGYGVYGLTAWLEVLQRQAFSALFLLNSQKPDENFLFANHFLRVRNFDLNTFLYHGPVLFAQQNGEWANLSTNQLVFDLQRRIFLNGSERHRLFAKLAYGNYRYRFLDDQSSLKNRFQFQGLSFIALYRYHLPTIYGFTWPRRLLELKTQYLHTFQSDYAFTILQFDLNGATIVLDDHWLINQRTTFLRQTGILPPLKTLGIDRFYELDFPRDYTFTRTIRGLRKDLNTDQLLWSSTELRYFVTANSGWKLLFLPVKNVVLTAFGDYAQLGRTSQDNWFSIGFQTAFGEDFARFSAGYARVFHGRTFNNESFFLRLSLLVDALLE